jgi:transcriptional regulator with XRE-family HTH domain
MKAEERKEARRLRREAGMSMKAIARQLEVSVSSVSLWTRDIELTPEQIAVLAAQNHRFDRQRRGQAARGQSARIKRLISQLQGRAMARCGDPLHQAGCMLYWAEGTKSRNNVIFVNSDPHMLRFFKRFLRSCYAVPADRLIFSVNCYVNNGFSLTEIERYWLEALELSAACLRKATVNNPPRASKQQRRNLPYGTGRLVVHSTAIVQSIYGAIQEYAGCDEPAWLG